MVKNFFIVDVFAENKYSGNQLAVFLDAENIPPEEMQLIAREMNYSETTFVSSQEKSGSYDVRIFTPECEVPFAGHPTLGTAFVVQQEIIKREVERVILNLKVGQIPVFFSGSGGEKVLWMRQRSPSFGERVEKSVMVDVLGLAVEDLDERFPIEEVSTGLPALIVPLKSLLALKRIRVNVDKYNSLVEKLNAKLILAFCPETRRPDTSLSVRVFAYYYGVPEDPATGSANGCLAAYLSKYKYFGSDEINIKVEQGYEVRRPSLLFLKTNRKEEEIEVLVGGKVILIGKGSFV
ncbi:MAG: PhzF family phenazine biosynthesis protein [Synergistetes bacterium]|nr:PhzF family phenazine biosynthesis protein [Synergistota bacterium]MDW8191367.1 PhzF family phenazine biosynthesis protein [Synergistota bacterium]